jgi:hypothetical protein
MAFLLFTPAVTTVTAAGRTGRRSASQKFCFLS